MRVPNVETLGYFRMSLRDKDAIGRGGLEVAQAARWNLEREKLRWA